MRVLLVLVALVMLSVPAVAHDDDWGDDWHDFGTTLGAFGESPVGEPVGVCWTTNSRFLDPDYPEFGSPGELTGHRGGVGVEYDGDCGGQEVGQDDPDVQARFG